MRLLFRLRSGLHPLAWTAWLCVMVIASLSACVDGAQTKATQWQTHTPTQISAQNSGTSTRECRQFKNIGLQASVSVIPAKAGTRNPVAGKYAFAANGPCIPAKAGMTVNMTTLPRTPTITPSSKAAPTPNIALTPTPVSTPTITPTPNTGNYVPSDPQGLARGHQQRWPTHVRPR